MSLHKSGTAGEEARTAPGYSNYDAVHSEVSVAPRTAEFLQRSPKHQPVRRTPEAASRNKSMASSQADAPKPLLNNISGTGTRKRNLKEGSSLLPRSVSKPYNDRPELLSSSGPPPPLPAPSSGSRIPVSSSFSKGTALGYDSTQRVLRRRAPSVEQHVSSLDRSRSHSKPHIDPTNDPPAKRHSKSFPADDRGSQPASILSVAPSEMIAPTTMLPTQLPGELPSALIPELKTLATANTFPQAASSAPLVSSVSSPSTRYSGSTGPWSSRDTTPTSISSCSPGLVQPSRTKVTSGLRKELPPRYDALASLKTSRMVPPASGLVNSFSSRNPSRSDKKEQNSQPQRGEKQNKRTVTPTPPASMPLPRKTSIRSKSSQEGGEASDQGAANSFPEHKAKARSIGGGPLKESTSTVAISSKYPSTRELRRRPSRTGTAGPDSKSSPVVQSNLSPQSLRGHRGRDSLDVGQLGQTPYAWVSARGTNADPQKEQLAQAQDLHRPVPQQVRIRPGSTRLPVKRPSQGTTKPVLATNEHNDQESRGTRRSTISRLSSRLGIFSRRPKGSHDDTSPKENRDLRKGPAAGTGHEGYGKYARRGRKHSVGSVNSSRERSTSTISGPSLRRKHSLASTGGSDYEEFVAQRLQPIIIPGGGSQDVGPDGNAPKVWPPVWPPLHRASSGSELNLHLVKQPTRDEPGLLVSDARSMSASSVATDAPSLVATDVRPDFVSKVISNQKHPGYAPPSIDGYSTSQSSLMQDETPAVALDEQLRRPLTDLKTASKAGKRFKWNFFRRKTSPKKVNVGPEEHVAGSMHVPVAVSSVSVHKPIPYYALIDSENEDEGGNGLRNILDQVHEPPSPVAEVSSEPHGLGLRQQYGQSVLLPSMPTMHEEVSSPASLSSPVLASGYESQPSRLPSPTPRQSLENQRHRLPQVGRIPRVISRRDRQHKPAMTSFSRPFQFENLGDVPKGSGEYRASIAETRRPILGIRTDVLPSRPFFTPESGQAASAPTVPHNIRPLGDFESQSENVIFPGSVSPFKFQSSSPKRIFSTTKIWPSAAHHHHTEEDEIWNEYDDLLDNVLSPTSPDRALSTPRSGPASYPLPGETRRESVLRQETLQGSREYMHQIQIPSPRLSLPHPSPRDIVSALHSKPSVSPSSPFSISDYSMGYPDHRLGGTDVRQHIRGASAVEPGLLSPSSANTGYREFPKVPEVSHHQSTALLDVAERDGDDPAGHSDLRFAALMTSRWLSFGRVLFSPAHEVVEANAGQRILVIDGLGNDDWSFYCAATYPEAFVYRLEETDGAAESRREPSQDSRPEPSNYRRVELPNLAERFPFPQSLFAAVVFRFPVAMSDTILKMALSECKRVLVPGGHIELSLLDLDVVNMGTITRHTIRDLKSRMIAANPEVSLKPVSDNIQNMLGLKGFENLNRCLVSVPVTGKVATSSDSRSSRSSRDSIQQRGKEGDGASGVSVTQNRGSGDTDRYQKRGGNFSLSELVSDHSATSDEKIAKMVAKVGRWWYTRTYELAVLPRGDLKKSIWSDRKMLHECKVRGSGFRLLIAYAQKPTETRRRTLSEPVRPTTAVAGTGMMKHFDEVYPQGETHQFLPLG